VLLWSVVVEDAPSGALDRVLLYGAEEQPEAETLARGLYRALGRAPERYRFWLQPLTEVSSPQGVVYRLVLRRLPSARC
jgi:hypothetical protein